VITWYEVVQDLRTPVGLVIYDPSTRVWYSPRCGAILPTEELPEYLQREALDRMLGLKCGSDLCDRSTPEVNCSSTWLWKEAARVRRLLRERGVAEPYTLTEVDESQGLVEHVASALAACVGSVARELREEMEATLWTMRRVRITLEEVWWAAHFRRGIDVVGTRKSGGGGGNPGSVVTMGTAMGCVEGYPRRS